MDVIKFAKAVGKLKKLKRAGWVVSKIPHPESVAEHSFRVVILAMALAPRFGLDQLKVMKMALVHDVGEAKVGDIITMNGNKIIGDPNKKLNKERTALGEIFSILKDEEYLKLFDEFEENKTKEARLVKQLDKLEMAIQASEYEEEYGVDLASFYENTRAKLEDDYFIKLLNNLKKPQK